MHPIIDRIVESPRYHRYRERALQWLIGDAPRWVWDLVGPGIAEIRPIGWYPKWRFGDVEDDSTERYLWRKELWERSRWRPEPISFVTRWLRGLRVRLTLGNDLSWCLFVAGVIDPNEFALLDRLLRKDMVVIDVGASDGLYTLFAAQRVGRGGRVVSLEPSSRDFARLESNLRLNALGNVAPLKVGAGARARRALLKIVGSGHEGHNTLGELVYEADTLRTEEVAIRTLDRIVDMQGLDRVDIIKIDAEGAELAILQGAEGILGTRRPLLLIEILDDALSAQDTTAKHVLSLLDAAGYELWVFGGTGCPEPAPSMEADGCNVVAVYPGSDMASALRAAASMC